MLFGRSLATLSGQTVRRLPGRFLLATSVTSAAVLLSTGGGTVACHSRQSRDASMHSFSKFTFPGRILSCLEGVAAIRAIGDAGGGGGGDVSSGAPAPDKCIPGVWPGAPLRHRYSSRYCWCLGALASSSRVFLELVVSQVNISARPRRKFRHRHTRQGSLLGRLCGVHRVAPPVSTLAPHAATRRHARRRTPRRRPAHRRPSDASLSARKSPNLMIRKKHEGDHLALNSRSVSPPLTGRLARPRRGVSPRRP